MAVVKETQNSRLDRIEEKIDKLSDAMISLARAEEKLIAIEKNNHANYDRMNRFSQKLDNIENKVNDNARTIGVITKSFWLIVGAVAVALAGQYFM
jgi:tetrahydromethanopterin S-methyltransferase subunit G